MLIQAIEGLTQFLAQSLQQVEVAVFLKQMQQLEARVAVAEKYHLTCLEQQEPQIKVMREETEQQQVVMLVLVVEVLGRLVATHHTLQAQWVQVVSVSNHQSRAHQHIVLVVVVHRGTLLQVPVVVWVAAVTAVLVQVEVALLLQEPQTQAVEVAVYTKVLLVAVQVLLFFAIQIHLQSPSALV